MRLHSLLLGLAATQVSGFIEGARKPYVPPTYVPPVDGGDGSAVVVPEDGSAVEPVQPVQPSPTPAPGLYKAVMHDFNTKDDCEFQNPMETTDCFKGNDGYYRYACDGDQVKTDVCTSDSCSPDSCAGEWTWHEEHDEVCYNDGNSLYAYECTDQGPDDVYVPPALIEGASPKTCDQLGWEYGKIDTVCAQSKINKECSEAMMFEEAEATCKSVGARLCTSDELSNDAAKDSGCKGDCKNTWSSDECASGHTTQAGAKKCLKDYPATCSSNDVTANVRCCADQVNQGEVEKDLPSGYVRAVASDYKEADKACGGKPTDMYSCWTNPATGGAQRFACNGDDNIWAQNCGTDDSCSPENCSGAWFTYGEKPDKCYSEGDSLYMYKCQ